MGNYLYLENKTTFWCYYVFMSGYSLAFIWFKLALLKIFIVACTIDRVCSSLQQWLEFTFTVML